MERGSSTGTLYERSVLWSKSMELFREVPLSGVGAGNWKYNFPLTGMDGLTKAETNLAFFVRPHNDFISMLTELGLPGFLLFIFILGVLVGSFYKAVFSEGFEGNREFLILSFGGSIALQESEN